MQFNVCAVLGGFFLLEIFIYSWKSGSIDGSNLRVQL